MSKKSDIGAFLYLCILIAIVTTIVSSSWASDKYERKVPYTGPKLGSRVVICSAKQIAAAGFWRELTNAEVIEGARIEEESKPTHWRIVISGETESAEVIRFNANDETLEAPTLFTAEFTPGGGLLLVKKDRQAGTSPETISIDPVNSSFVYSSQHASVLYNRANIWYGACKPYG